MKLITEYFEESNIQIEEGESGKKSFFIEGPFMVADTVNKNRRFYPSSILDPEVARYIKEEVNDNRAYGELNHPAQVTVSLDRVSHIIKSLRKEGNNWIGKAKLLETPCGKIAQELINEGCRLGISSRALGDVKQRGDGINEVQKNLRLAAIDLVSSPSGPGCFVNGIMENIQFWYDEERGVYMQEYAENLKKEIKQMTVQEIEETKLKLFENYLQTLVKKQ